MSVRQEPVELFRCSLSVNMMVLGLAVAVPTIFAVVLATLSGHSVSAFVELPK